MTARLLYLVRHGAVEGEDGRKFISSTDLPLSREGKEQALQLRSALSDRGIGAAYCSDLLRCRQTARIIADENSRTPIHERRDLREVSMGIWEGRSRAEIAAMFPDEFRARGEDIEHYCVPGGESLDACRSRALAAWQEIVESSPENVLIVGHAGVNRLLLCHLLQIPTGNLFRIGQDHGCLNIIHHKAGAYRLVLLNFTPSRWAAEADRLHGRIEGTSGWI